MLSNLFIKNFVLIDEISIDFPNGLISVTGETGAGKSIILGALKLVLGGRADSKVFANESEKCVIEATFILNESFKSFFNENDLDYEDITLFRREISPQGKSRAFVNDVPVTLDILNQLSNKLIDIHSQFDTAALLTTHYQMYLLDSFSNLQAEVAIYKNTYLEYKSLKSKLNECKTHLSDAIKEKEYNTFLLDELRKTSLENIDLLHLENELKEQEHAEDLVKVYSECYQFLNNEEIGTEYILRECSSKLSKYASISDIATAISERVQSIRIEVQDISSEIEKAIQNLELNPEKLIDTKHKVDAIHSLFVKHHVKSVEELKDIQKNLELKSDTFSNLENEIQTLEKKIQDIEINLKKIALKLDQKRTENAPILVEKIMTLLAKLGLDKAQLKIQIEKEKEFNDKGINSIQFLFSANTGMALQPIAKAISGGERSRVMMVLKKIIAENETLPTLIFDEIDTGVSGRIADEMGNLMQEMASSMQMIVITHLPQVAAKGSSHFKVVKEEINGVNKTFLKSLNKDERINEVAQLLSGANLTDAAINQAISLLKY